MSGTGAHLLSKVMAVGVMGALAAMGLLLFTLNVARPVDDPGGPDRISPLAFEALLARGEVLQCAYHGGELLGVRRGADGERIPFEVTGEVAPRLLERIRARGVPLVPGAPTERAKPPASAARVPGT